MFDSLIPIWNILRIILLCAAGFVFVITTSTALIIIVFAMEDKRSAPCKRLTPGVWLFAFFCQISCSLFAYAVWRALYYRIWQPVIWVGMALIPWLIIGSIIFHFGGIKIKSEN